jgi:F-type H+-transporting ATPase subunit epsilon
MAEIPKLPTKLQLTVVTRERKLLEVEVDEVMLPGADGAIGILPGHTPLLTILRIGEMTYRIGAKQHHLVLRWGFAEVLPDRVIVLAEGAYRADEFSREDVERERIEAERELASLAAHDEGFALAEAKLEESIAKLHLLGRDH